MVRQFCLVNEKNEEICLMDFENYCFLENPEGLGLSFNNEYAHTNNVFVNIKTTIAQSQIGATLNFKTYENYFKVAQFITRAKELRLKYVVPIGEGITYYRDIDIKDITKTEINELNYLSESITIEAKTLWYTGREIVYDRGNLSRIIKWNFTWNSRFSNTALNIIDYNNDSQDEARIILEVPRFMCKPSYNSITRN